MKVIWEHLVFKFSSDFTQHISFFILVSIFLPFHLNGTPALSDSLDFLRMDQRDSIAGKPDYHFKLSYWNDNFGYQNAIRDLVYPGKDDGVTAAFRLQYGIFHHAYTTNIDLYYAILTNRESDYRLDLIAVRVTNEKTLSWGSVMLGFGMIGHGNFGGAKIQNWYHKLGGYTEVDLEYLDESTFGITATAQVQNTIWQKPHTTVSSFLATSLRTGTGVSYLRGGLTLNQTYRIPEFGTPGQIQLLVGGFNYFPTLQIFNPLFRQGLMAGGLVSAKIFPHGTLSLWATMNQYGLKSPHYGITIAYQSKIFHPGNLSGVLFP